MQTLKILNHSHANQIFLLFVFPVGMLVSNVVLTLLHWIIRPQGTDIGRCLLEFWNKSKSGAFAKLSPVPIMHCGILKQTPASCCLQRSAELIDLNLALKSFARSDVPSWTLKGAAPFRLCCWCYLAQTVQPPCHLLN